MNRITKITLRNFQGINCTLDLTGPRAVLLGPNGSGKTAILRAVQFAIFGHANLGKKSDDTAVLFPGKGGSVDVELSSGFAFSRGLERDPESGRITTTAKVNGEFSRSRSIAACNAQILSDTCFNPPMGVADELRGLSPDKRRQFIMKLCQSDQTGDREALIGRIALRAACDLTSSPFDREGRIADGATYDAKIKSFEADIAPSAWTQLIVMRSQVRAAVSDDELDSLFSADEVLKGIESSAKAGAAGARAAQGTLSAALAELRAQGVREVTKAAVDERIEALAQLREQRAEQVGREKSRASLAETLDRVKAGIESARTNRGACNDRAKRASEALAAIPEPADVAEPVESETAFQASRVALNKLNEAQAQAQAAIVALGDLRKEQSAAREYLDATAKNPFLGALNLAREMVPLAPIPEWGAKIDALIKLLESGLKETVAKKALIAHQSERRESAIADAERRVKTTELERGAAKREFDSALNAQVQEEAENKAAGERAAELRGQREAALAERRKHADAAHAESLEAARLETVIADREAEALKLQKQIDELKHGDGVADNLDEAIRMAEADRVEVEKCAELWGAMQAKEAALTDAKRRAADDEAAYTVAKSFRHAIKDERGAVLQKIVGPFADAVSAAFEAAGYMCQISFANDRGGADFDFRVQTRESGLLTPIDALSGGEMTVASAAIALAISQIRGEPINLQLIDADSADMMTLGRLIDMLGAFDCVAMIANHTAEAVGAKGWQSVKMPETAVRA